MSKKYKDKSHFVSFVNSELGVVTTAKEHHKYKTGTDNHYPGTQNWLCSC